MVAPIPVPQPFPSAAGVYRRVSGVAGYRAVQGGTGNTIYADSASRADVADAVAAASNGDTVILPSSSSATWTSTLSISKAITLDFNGCTITRSMSGTNVGMIEVTGVADSLIRLTNGIFSGGSSGTGFNGRYIRVFLGDDPIFRLDHCTFNDSGGNCMVQITHGDNVNAVIDNCEFTNASTNETIHNEGYGFGATDGWAYIVTQGSADALYVEDCTFYWTGGSSFGGNNAMQNYYGSRTVYRYNDAESAQFDNHGTAGMVGGRWYEIYENIFRATANMDKVFQLRAGSGVITGNVLRNESGAAGSRGIVLWEEDTGTYPLAYQIGRGKDQALDPLYIWDNTVEDGGGGTDGFDIGADPASLIQASRDYYTSAKSGWTPYTYPHPLRT